VVGASLDDPPGHRPNCQMHGTPMSPTPIALGHTYRRETTTMTNIRTAAAILVGAAGLSLIAALAPNAALAHADSGPT